MQKVSILIVTYLKENQKYLDLCLRSVANLNYPKDLLDVLVLSTGDYEPHTMGFRSVHTDRHMHFPEGVNYGVSLLDKDSKYIFILNDDVILTKNSLDKMVGAAGDADCIIGPVSNCDTGWLHSLSYIGYTDGAEFKPFQKRSYSYEDVSAIADKMMDTNVLANPGVWRQVWIAFYAVLIPRKVWDKVGGLDPKFLTGCDDLDMCIRCKQAKVGVLIEQSALIWHASGKTADVALNKDIRNANDKYFEEKWNISPYAFH